MGTPGNGLVLGNCPTTAFSIRCVQMGSPVGSEQLWWLQFKATSALAAAVADTPGTTAALQPSANNHLGNLGIVPL